MNCQDIAFLLDDRDVRGLDAAENESVQSHLHTCAECTAAWDAHARVLAQSFPAMRRELPQDLWQALRAAEVKPSRRPYSRPTLVGLVIAGAAAAMLMLESPFEENASGVSRNGWTPAPSEIEAEPSGTNAIAPFEGTFDGQAADNSSVAAPSRRTRLAVLPTLHEATNQAAIDDVNATRTGVVSYLRARTDLEIVEITELEEANVPAYLARLSDLFRSMLDWGSSNPRSARDWAVARHFGADAAVRFISKPPFDEQLAADTWTIELTQVERNGGGSSRSVVEPGSDPEFRQASLAREIYVDIRRDSAGDLYASEIADARLSDAARLRALYDANGRVGLHALVAGEHPAAIVAAASEFGRNAVAPETRRAVWQALISAPYPSVAQALADALTSDRDARVRQAVARGLREYTHDARVRALLQSTAAGDPSAIVRREAQWVLLGEAERRTFLESTLRDRSLPKEEQVATLLLAYQTSRAIYDAVALPDAEAVALLAEAVRSDGDSQTRQRAVSALGSNVALVDSLLHNLDDSDVYIRRTAFFTLLRTFRDVPGVLAAVERAHAREPDAATRYDVERALVPPLPR